MSSDNKSIDLVTALQWGDRNKDGLLSLEEFTLLCRANGVSIEDEIKKSLLAARQKGVKIRIFTDDEKMKDKGSDILELAKNGIKVRVDIPGKHMHHKFAIFDWQKMMNGSCNWTTTGLYNRNENIHATGNSFLVKTFKTEFEKLWRENNHRILKP